MPYVSIEKLTTHLKMSRYIILDGIARGMIRHRTDVGCLAANLRDTEEWRDHRKALLAEDVETDAI